MSAFEIAGSANVKVIVEDNGDKTEYEYPADMVVFEAIQQTGRKAGFKTVNAYDKSGRELAPSEANKTLAQVGELTVVKKDAGN